MRLLLTIQRNDLPSTRIVHYVPVGTSAPITVAQLLAEIDATIPLESGTWGLSDYVVEIAGGYECLHFQHVAHVMQDGQEITIRALQKEDLRARRLGGRHQISAAGVVLKDGIAWGRLPWPGRTNERPAVEIPHDDRLEQYRREIDVQDAGAEEEESARRLRIMDRPASATPNGSRLHHDDDDGSNEWQPRSILREQGEPRSRPRIGSVSFVEGPAAEDDKDDDDEDDDEDDYEPSTEEEDEDEDSDVDMDSDDSAPPEEEYTPRERTTNGLRHPANDEDETGNDCVAEELNTKQLSQGSVVRRPQSRSSAAIPLSHFLAQAEQQQPPQQNPPFTGLGRTKARNLRRKWQRALSVRQKLGLEKPNTTLTEFKEKCRVLPTAEQPSTLAKEADIVLTTSETAQADADFQRRRQALLSALSSNAGIDIDRDVLDQNADMGQLGDPDQSQLGMSQIESSKSNSEANMITYHILTTKPTTNGTGSTSAIGEATAGTQSPQMDDADSGTGKRKAKDLGRSEDEAKQPRSRTLDVASSRRLVFGGLGLRNPKTKEEEDRTRTKLAALGKRAAVATNKTHEPLKPRITPTAENADLDAWKNKIVLTAVECFDEDVVLSTPPFPFIQRWDPSQQIPRNKSGKRRSKSSSASNGYEHADDYTHTSNYDQGPGLDYGEEPVYNEVSQPSSITTHLSQSSYSQSNSRMPNTTLGHATHNQSLPTPSSDLSDDEVIPALPADLTALPVLTLSDIQPGAVIVFKQSQMNRTTWAPEISGHKTTTVLPDLPLPQRANDMISLLLAKRDRVSVQYDENGYRVLGLFDMPGDEERQDKEARGEVELCFDELLEARLLRAAPSVEGDGVQEQIVENVAAGNKEEDRIETQEEEKLETDEQHVAEAEQEATQKGSIEDGSQYLPRIQLYESYPGTVTQPSQVQAQTSLPSSSQNFLDSISSSLGHSSPSSLGDVDVQVEDSQVKGDVVENLMNGSRQAMTGHAGPANKKAKTKRVMRKG